MIKSLPTNEILELNSFTGELYKTFRKELLPMFLKLFKKNCRGRKTVKFFLLGHYHLGTKSKQRYQEKIKL